MSGNHSIERAANPQDDCEKYGELLCPVFTETLSYGHGLGNHSYDKFNSTPLCGPD